MIEPNDDPVWCERAKSLQSWLRTSGPRGTNNLTAWAKTEKLAPSVVTNVLAFSDGVYIQFLRDKWWAAPVTVEELNKPEWSEARSSAECRAEYGSPEADGRRSEPDSPAPAESQPDKPHPPA